MIMENSFTKMKEGRKVHASQKRKHHSPTKFLFLPLYWVRARIRTRVGARVRARVRILELSGRNKRSEEQ